MKKTCLMLLAALCALMPAAGAAEGLPDFLSAVSGGMSDGMAVGTAQIAAAMDQELALTLELDSARIEANQTVILRVTAENPRAMETPVSFVLNLPERLSSDQETIWEAVLPAATEDEQGVPQASVAVFERELALVPGGESEQARITCEMSMGTRFYRATQTIDLCVADVTTTAKIVSEKGDRLQPGEAFTYRIEVENAGMAAQDVELAMVLPDGVTLEGDVPAELTLRGSRLTGVVRAEAAQADETGVAASLKGIELPVHIDENALEDDEDATRLLSGVLYANGSRVAVPRVQVCDAKISARLLAEADELAAGEEMTLRLLVTNEGLAGADVELSCALPEGLTPVKAKTKSDMTANSAKESTAGEATAGEAAPSRDDDAPLAGELVPAQSAAADLAQAAVTTSYEGDAVIFSLHMDAAEETEAGRMANTQIIELRVKADAAQENLDERLVGAALAWQVNEGETQLGDAVAMRVYRPALLGMTEEDWEGVFWASLLLLVTVGCLWAAVRSERKDDEYLCD